jgi:hypothetical protein
VALSTQHSVASLGELFLIVLEYIDPLDYQTDEVQEGPVILR